MRFLARRALEIFTVVVVLAGLRAPLRADAAAPAPVAVAAPGTTGEAAVSAEEPRPILGFIPGDLDFKHMDWKKLGLRALAIGGWTVVAVSALGMLAGAVMVASPQDVAASFSTPFVSPQGIFGLALIGVSACVAVVGAGIVLANLVIATARIGDKGK